MLTNTTLRELEFWLKSWKRLRLEDRSKSTKKSRKSLNEEKY